MNEQLLQYIKDAGLGKYEGFFTGDVTGEDSIASKLGLTGEQAKMFGRFAMPFQKERFEKMVKSLQDYETKQTGFIGEQHALGKGRARTGLSQNLSGLRQNLQLGAMQAAQRGGGFAGAGAQQSALQLARDAASQRYGGLTDQYQTQLSGLGLAQEKGLSA